MSITARASESDVHLDINGRTFYFKVDDAEDMASQIISAVYDARQNAKVARKERIVEIRQTIVELQAELLRLDSADAEEKEETPAPAAPTPWTPPGGIIFEPHLINFPLGHPLATQWADFPIHVDSSLPDNCIRVGRQVYYIDQIREECIPVDYDHQDGDPA